MARFCGKVGYVTREETAPGVWEDAIVTRTYYGDVIRNKSMWQIGESINDDINISTDISIMADAYAYQHFSEIRFVEFMDAKWKVTSASPERPRITLTLGGLCNEQD
jgi:hypothetical protein